MDLNNLIISDRSWVSFRLTPKRARLVRGSFVLFECLMPPKITATIQGEHVSSLTLMPKWEKRVWVPLLPSMPKWEIVGMFYRKCILVIDGKYNNDDVLSTGIMCQRAPKVFWEDIAEKAHEDQKR